MNEKLLKLAEKLEEKKAKEKMVKDRFEKLNKVKKLTQEQRISRIEELLGIID